MQTNNAETITEAVTEQATNDTASTEDTSSTTEVSAIEEVKTSKEGEQSSSESEPSTDDSQSEPIYLIGDKEITASRLEALEK